MFQSTPWADSFFDLVGESNAILSRTWRSPRAEQGHRSHFQEIEVSYIFWYLQSKVCATVDHMVQTPGTGHSHTHSERP